MLRGDRFVADGIMHKLRDRMCAQLVQDVGPMRFHRHHADPRRGSRFFVALARQAIAALPVRAVLARRRAAGRRWWASCSGICGRSLI